MNDRLPPHDLDAERALLGAMMLTRSAIADSVDLVAPEDFYAGPHRSIHAAIVGLWRAGQPADPVTVGDVLDRDGALAAAGGRHGLVVMQGLTPSTDSAARYAEIVAEAARLRRIIGHAAEITEAAYGRKDSADILDRATAGFAEVGSPSTAVPDGLWSVDDYLARPDSELAPWAVPGVLRIGWRALVVAPEGVGKTELTHQVALAASQGIHPFALTKCPPITTLMCDFENPDERLMAGFAKVTDVVRRRAGDRYAQHQAWLWHREGGINVRQRTDRAALESVIANVRPQLVCVGPIYKSYRVAAREPDELATGEALAVWDDLRTRYGFALFMEHHAPKGSSGVRDLLPFGSSMWLRWPEFGLTLVRDPERNHQGENLHFKLGRFRHDRLPAEWPARLSKSTRALPWEAGWDDDRWQSAGRTPGPDPDDDF